MSADQAAKMHSKVLPVLAVFFLLLLIACAFLISPNNELKHRGSADLPMKLAGGPILQIELARDEEDIKKVLLTGDVAQNVRDARKGNTWDSFLFIPSYASFLLVIGILLARDEARLGRTLILVASVTVPIAAACDWAENYGISRTLGHIEHEGGPQLGDAKRISIPSVIKWSLIAGTMLFFGFTAVRRPDEWERFILGALFVVLGVAIALMLGQYASQLHLDLT